MGLKPMFGSEYGPLWRGRVDNPPVLCLAAFSSLQQPLWLQPLKSWGAPVGPRLSLSPLSELWNKEEKSSFFQTQLWVKNLSAREFIQIPGSNFLRNCFWFCLKW